MKSHTAGYLMIWPVARFPKPLFFPLKTPIYTTLPFLRKGSKVTLHFAVLPRASTGSTQLA